MKQNNKLKIAVIGDIMLDTYYKGPWRKIGPEEIPVISIEKVTNQLGAAATTANSIKIAFWRLFIFCSSLTVQRLSGPDFIFTLPF